MKIEIVRDAINTIERALDVNDIKIKDVSLWPIIRSVIVEKSKKNKSSYYKNKKIIYYKKIRNLINPVILRLIKRNRIIVHTPVSAKDQKVNGKIFSKFSDSLSLIDKDHLFIEIGIYDQDKCDFSSKTLFVLIKSLIKNLEIRNEHKIDEVIRKASDLKIVEVSKSEIKNAIFNTYCYYLANKIILKFINPKCIIAGCFYSSSTFGLCWAASQLKIPIVELQHGQQGDFNLMYTSWASLPEKGYKLIPPIFASWGDDSTQRLRKYFPTTHHYHVHTFGNPWLAIHAHQLITNQLDDTAQAFFKKISHQKVVLIGLQPLREWKDIFPELLMETINQTAETHFYLFRLHPLMFANQKVIEDYLDKKIKLSNYELNISSDVPLYELLKHVDVNITYFSSIAYEALAFGVHSIIIHPTGKEMMRHYIAEQIFGYADSSSALLAQIDKRFNLPSHHYLVTNLDNMKKAINQFCDQRYS